MGNNDSPGDAPDPSTAIRQLMASRNDPAALEAALAEHRGRLRRMVALRLDRRLQGRIDPSDVIQEAYLEAAPLPEYLREPKPMPLFLWLRFLAAQSLQVVHRKHLGVMARDAGREISIHAGRMPQATSAALAAQLLGHDTRASEAAIRAERRLRLEQALNQMDPLDREVLAAPLRAALEFRVRPGAGPERNDRDQTLYTRAEEAQGDPEGSSRRQLRGLI